MHAHAAIRAVVPMSGRTDIGHEILRHMSMSNDEFENFLAQSFPTPLGVVSTLRKDGSPHVIPVWFRWNEGAITLWTKEGRVWVNNVARDPRVAFSVQTFEAPYPAVMMRGRATITTADSGEVVAEAKAITSRYVGPDEVDGYVDDWPDLRTIVTIVPDHIVSWSAGG